MKHLLTLLALPLISMFLLFGCSGPQKEEISTKSPEALALFKEGRALYEKFYYEEALAALKKSSVADSLFALPYLYRAAVAFALSDEPEARALVGKAVQLSAGASPSEQLLCRMWAYRIQFDFRSAAAAADSLVERFPWLSEPYVVRGELYRMNKNLEAAIKIWEKALKNDSTCSRAVMWLGYAHAEMGDGDKGISYMKRYIRLVPDAADPRASTGDILMGAGRYEDALDQYKKALELKSTFWYAYQKIGDIYALYGRLKEAQEQYEHAQQVLPHTSRLPAVLLTVRARFNVMRARYDDAERECLEALAIDSTNVSAAFRLVIAQTRQKKIVEAERTLDRLEQELQRRNITGTTEMTAVFLARSIIEDLRGNAAAALAACDSAVQYAPIRSRVEVYLQFAAIQLRAKEYEAALDACDEALRVAPNYPFALLALLRVYRAKGDAQMTAEIGGRLTEFWKGADPDFAAANELRTLLRRTVSH